MIRRIASSHEVNGHLAEDLVQEILLAVWKALPRFRGRGSARAFVARVATNLAVTHVRRAMRAGPAIELTEDLISPDPGPEDEVAALGEKARLLLAVRALPLAYREVALLTLEGLSPAETAEVLGITPNAVAIRLSRAKQLLRTHIRE